MSTKIYNGYRFKNKLTLSELSNLIQIFFTKEQITSYVSETWSKFVTDIYVTFLDGKNADVEGKTVDALLRQEIKSLKDELEEGYRTYIDLSASISIKEYRGRFYVGLFCDDQQLADKIIQHFQLEEYMYWDNTDRPDELSNKQWSRRCEVWETLFNNSSWKRAGFLNIDLITMDDRNYIPRVSRFQHMNSEMLSLESRWNRYKTYILSDYIFSRDYGIETHKDRTRDILIQIEEKYTSGKYDPELYYLKKLFFDNAVVVTDENFHTLTPSNLLQTIKKLIVK